MASLYRSCLEGHLFHRRLSRLRLRFTHVREILALVRLVGLYHAMKLAGARPCDPRFQTKTLAREDLPYFRLAYRCYARRCSRSSARRRASSKTVRCGR